jgi:hypothetical protein
MSQCQKTTSDFQTAGSLEPANQKGSARQKKIAKEAYLN